MKKSFILHLDTLEILDELTDDQAGKLLKAIFNYQKGEEVGDLDFALKLLFSTFKKQFERDKTSYNKRCETNRGNGSLGGKAKSSKRKRTVANGSERKRKLANLADSDSDSDSDSGNESGKKKEQFTPPPLETFLEYSKLKAPADFLRIKQDLILKYESWKENNWHDGNQKQIKNWKSTLLNTLPYLIRNSKQAGKEPEVFKISDYRL